MLSGVRITNVQNLFLLKALLELGREIGKPQPMSILKKNIV
jgi:hypothetical protein